MTRSPSEWVGQFSGKPTVGPFWVQCARESLIVRRWLCRWAVRWFRSRSPVPRRVATLSVHTSPLDQPGTGDAGGMNVYVLEVSRRLAEMGVAVDVFTRATSSALPPVVEMSPGRAGPARRRRAVRGAGQGRPAGPAVRVHVRGAAGRGRPGARLVRPRALPLLAVRAGRAGSPGRAGRCRWCTPRTPWPRSRTPRSPTATARSRWPGWSARTGSRPRPTGWSPPPRTRPTSSAASTARGPSRSSRSRRASTWSCSGWPTRRRRGPGSGCPRMPCCCCSSGASSRSRRPTCCCGPSRRCSSGCRSSDAGCRSRSSEARAGPGWTVPSRCTSWPPRSASPTWSGSSRRPARDRLADWYRAADVTVVPSHSESFGLVALESQACGTPVVAAAVGGLPTAVEDGVSGCWSTPAARPTSPPRSAGWSPPRRCAPDGRRRPPARRAVLLATHGRGPAGRLPWRAGRPGRRGARLRGGRGGIMTDGARGRTGRDHPDRR